MGLISVLAACSAEDIVALVCIIIGHCRDQSGYGSQETKEFYYKRQSMLLPRFRAFCILALVPDLMRATARPPLATVSLYGGLLSQHVRLQRP